MTTPSPTHIRIKEIGLRDFQAFPGSDYTVINLLQRDRGKGLSLLLYGENGSGKSSLGRALRDMLSEASRTADSFDRSRHTFSDPPSPDRSVTLEFDDPSQPLMAWKPGEISHTSHPLFEAMSKSRGWMDYRTLWAALDFGYSRDFADVFSALADTLLQDCDVPATTNLTFGTLWSRIQRRANRRPTTGYLSDVLHSLKMDIGLFSSKLSAFLPLLQDRANELLYRFVPWTVISLNLDRPPVYSSSRRNNKFTIGTVSLRVTFKESRMTKLDGFLNEARITAIALSLFLAALTLSTPPRLADGTYFPRLLILDDILISLDMAHRRPLLEVLNEHFSGWQVFLLTHDRAWYEMAKSQLSQAEWKFVEMFAVPFGPYEQPMVKDDAPHLERARSFLANGEIKAAAVHTRTQFELTLKAACRELNLKVNYVDDPKKWDANHFWDTLKVHWKHRADLVSEVRNVSHSLSWVLNPHSHSRPVDHIRREIGEAIDAVAALEVEVAKEIAARRAEAARRASEAEARALAAIPAPQARQTPPPSPP